MKHTHKLLLFACTALLGGRVDASKKEAVASTVFAVLATGSKHRASVACVERFRALERLKKVRAALAQSPEDAQLLLEERALTLAAEKYERTMASSRTMANFFAVLAVCCAGKAIHLHYTK